MRPFVVSSSMALAALLLGASPAVAGETMVRVMGAPPSGLVITRIDASRLGPGARSGQVRLQAKVAGKAVPAQLVPAADGGPATLVVQAPRGGDTTVNLVAEAAGPATPVDRALKLQSRGFAITFDPKVMAGMPSRIDYDGGSPPFTGFSWNDRVHSGGVGGFSLRNDRHSRVRVVSEGPLCTVVRIEANYCSEPGQPAPYGARAVMDWYVFREQPRVYVTLQARQQASGSWAELHFLELNWPDNRFPRWMAGDPLRSGQFTASQKGDVFPDWALATDGRSSVALIAGTARTYDGRGQYGTYLHGPWDSWTGAGRSFSAWLRFGNDGDASAAASALGKEFRKPVGAYVTDAGTESLLARLQARASRAPGSAGRRSRWLATSAVRMQRSGRDRDLAALASGRFPAGWSTAMANELGLALSASGGGIRLESLQDLARGVELLATNPAPLFDIKLLDTVGKQERSLGSDGGWGKAAIQPVGGGFRLAWDRHTDPALAGVRVEARATPGASGSAWRWTIQVKTPPRWSVMSVAFPQVNLAEPAGGGTAFYPTGPGVEVPGAWSTPVDRRGMYPDGWCTMQLMAAYGAQGGLYVAFHDPLGGAKQIIMQSDPAARGLGIWYSVPAPDMTRGGNGYVSPGPVVWQAMEGNWYDAARLYRKWVSAEAKWWPTLGPDGRADTPLWMRELSGWAQTGGAPDQVVGPVKEMQKALGVPIGFHWYSWHQIPFDNDYPHYFPTLPGVPEAVRDLQANQVRVMPYINGRLWDTHDRGAEDWQFTSLARPSATKKADGTPFIESYGSKESDGKPVELAPMCPTTKLWQDTVRGIVLRLQDEVGTSGVYIDQIAAAGPVLCMDPTHGHPLGGGQWWTSKGYWPLLTQLRAAMQKDRMITTECNAEPYIKFMDGYLSWHWQFENMVPAFPAVYAGAVQIFSRAYNAGAGTRQPALCQKMAQELVFGEQIGWLDPRIALEPVVGPYLRETIRTRSRFARYFYAGRMGRPVTLVGDVPRVRADWAWYGETWITTPAVLTGTWLQPQARRALVIFANVTDKPVSFTARYNPGEMGVPAGGARWSSSSGADAPQVPCAAPGKMTVPAHAVVTYEARW